MLTASSSHSDLGSVLLVALVGFAASLAPAGAAAEDSQGRDLLSYLPADSKFVAKLDVEKLRQSKYFTQAFDYLEENANDNADLQRFLSSDEGVDLRSDLESVGVALPVSRVAPNRELERGVFAMSGTFDAEQIRKLVKEEYEKLESREAHGLTIHRTEKAEFSILNKHRLVVTMGPESYRKGVWKLVAEGGKSFEDTAREKKLLEDLDTSRTLWLVNQPGRTEGPGSDVESAAVAVNLDAGVDLQIITRAGSEASAKEMLQQAKAMKKTGASNPMLAMFGATPLLENLELEHKKSSLLATTSMNEEQVDYLVDRIRQMASSGSQLSIPSSAETPSGSETDADESDQENASPGGSDEKTKETE